MDASPEPGAPVTIYLPEPPICIKCNGRVFRDDGCDYSNIHLKIIECMLCGQDQNAPVRVFKKVKMCEQIGCIQDGRRMARGRWLCRKDHDRDSAHVPTDDQKNWAAGHMLSDTSTSDIWGR